MRVNINSLSTVILRSQENTSHETTVGQLQARVQQMEEANKIQEQVLPPHNIIANYINRSQLFQKYSQYKSLAKRHLQN